MSKRVHRQHFIAKDRCLQQPKRDFGAKVTPQLYKAESHPIVDVSGSHGQRSKFVVAIATNISTEVTTWQWPAASLGAPRWGVLTLNS